MDATIIILLIIIIINLGSLLDKGNSHTRIGYRPAPPTKPPSGRPPMPPTGGSNVERRD
jgi:hypothetical protein